MMSMQAEGKKSANAQQNNSHINNSDFIGLNPKNDQSQ